MQEKTLSEQTGSAATWAYSLFTLRKPRSPLRFSQTEHTTDIYEFRGSAAS